MGNFFLYFTTVIIWGSTWIAIEYQLGIVDPIVSICYRFAIAAFCLFIFCGLTGRLKNPLTLRHHTMVALQGFTLFFFNYWLTYSGAVHLTSGLVSLCFSCITMMNIANQALFFKIRVEVKTLAGALIGLVGIGFVFGPEISQLSLADTTLLGLCLCLMGAYCASLGNMISVKNSRNNIPVVMACAFGMSYGAIFAAITAFVFGMDFAFDFSAAYIGSLLWLSVFGSAAAFVCFLTLINNIGADKGAYATVLFPVVALTISTFVEDYHWTISAVIGVVLILLGNVLAMARARDLRPLLYIFAPKGWRLFKKDAS